MANSMILGSLHQMTIGHTTQGMWRHPDAQADRYATIDYWLETAQTLERGGFDFLFFADVVGALDVYEGSPRAALEGAVELPMADPLLLISALAHQTSKLGYVVTASTSFEQPYLLARKYGTLDLLTDGRIGLNVVTSALESAAINLGYDTQIPHGERYDIADEFLDVTYKLWEGSWEDGAVKRDRGGVYTDASKVHPIEHQGKYFNVPGIALTEPSIQRTPVIFQAGTSERGKRFAADHAEAIFIVSEAPETTRRHIDDIRAKAVAAGRTAESVKVLAMATIIVAETAEAAQAKVDDYLQYFDAEWQLARLSSLFGIDLGAVELDEPLADVENDNSIKGLVELYTKVDPDKRWTTRQIAERTALSGSGALFIGTPESVVDEMEAWLEASGADGFNIADPVPPVVTDDFVRLVTPELRRRGLIEPEDAPAVSLRERLFGEGHARTRAGEHPSAQYRRG